MKDKNALNIFLIAIFLLMIGIRCSSPSREMGTTVKIGQEAPPFKLQDLAGREVSLKDYRGKIVVLDFWATWCGPCQWTQKMLEDLQKEYPREMSLLAINQEESDDVVRDYVQKQGLGAVVLLDKNGSIGRQYDAYNMIPKHFLIDRKGIVRYIKTGHDPQMNSQIKAEIDKFPY